MDTGAVDRNLLEAGGLRYAVSGAVATLTLDDAATRNAQTPATWEALRAVGESLEPQVRVVVVRGAGGTFSSGLDRRMLGPAGVDGQPSLLRLLKGPDDEVAARIATWQLGFTWLQRPDVVSIAVVDGPAVGAGFQLALACDLRVVSDRARFSMREPQLGLVPDLAGTKPLVELVGFSRALEICATTRWVQAEEARDLGLATVVVAAEELDETVADLVAAVTGPAHGAVSETKALLRSAGRLSLADQLRAEREAQVRRFRALRSSTGEATDTTGR